MNKKMNVFFAIAAGLILVVGSFLLININKDSTNKLASSDNGSYQYVTSNVLEVTKDEYIFNTMAFHKDNSLIYMVDSADGCYVYKGFGEDKEILSPNVESPRDDLDVKGFTIDDEENIYVLYGVWKGKETMNIYNKDKELVKADIDMEGDLTEIKDMYYFNEKLYILDYDYNLKIHTTDGKLTNDDVYSGNILSIDIDEAGNMYMIRSGGGSGVRNIKKVDCRSNQVIFDVKMEVSPQDIIKCSKINESIYTTDGKDIYEFDSTGSLVQKEVEFASDTSLVFGMIHDSGVHSLTNLTCDDKENFYVLAYGNQSLTNNIYVLTKTNGSKPSETPK